MVGYQPTFSKFVIHTVGLILISLNSFSIGLFVACIFANIEVALAVLPMFLVIPLVFGGFLVNAGHLQDWIAWLQWISPIKYGFTLLSTNLLKGYEIDGVDVGTSQLERLSLGPFGVLGCALFLFLFFVIFTLLSYYGLHRFMKKTTVKGQSENSVAKKKKVLLGPPDHKFTNEKDKPTLDVQIIS
ncbi:ABC transporter ATP-binding protein/permease wht-1 [Smittium culicis]|uniref:ABC transporter ATP-binding protein/permease wht-1 n=1 Tax=Smittium culicis TaxID=133412 RepID=A0A1R1YKX1_9FUNG|nr:ABC transporter ATP-binding protein/permease wht-1 [Smittium culicis]